MWDLIVSVPDHCLSFYFPNDHTIIDLESVVYQLYIGLVEKYCHKNT